jgi:hypothetical protein
MADHTAGMPEHEVAQELVAIRSRLAALVGNADD